MTQDPRYSFETRPTRQTEEAARQMLRTFLLRLGLGDTDQARLGPGDRKALLTFTTVCHLNVHWYDRQRKREQHWYRGFALFTALVLIGTPLAIFWAHHLDAQAQTAQVGVIIAGVLGAHRMLSTMFEKRNLVRHFWRAQADLKTLLYSFEDTWRGRLVAAALAPDQHGNDHNTDDQTASDQTANDQTANDQSANDQSANDQSANDLSAHDLDDRQDQAAQPLCLAAAFLDDLKVQLHQARQIKRQEQDEFFARYDSAFSNLSDILGFAHKQSSEVASAVQAPRRERADLITLTRGEIQELEAREQALATQLDQHRRDLDSAPGAAAATPFEDARRAALLGAVESLHREHLDAAFRLQAARARLQRIG
jgi:hypothetical protein